MEDTGFSIDINWVTVPIFLVLAIAIALYARHVSGGVQRTLDASPTHAAQSARGLRYRGRVSLPPGGG